MKAVVYERYGTSEVLYLTDIAKPTPTGNEVLVRVRAVAVNASDWEMLRGRPAYARIGGLFRPRRRVLGSDVAGRVEAIGPAVTEFGPGDDVFGDLLSHLGGFAEYVCVPQTALAPLPVGLSYEQAAALPQVAAIALQGIDGRIQAGQRVLINGGGGGAGMFAIQLAKRAGAVVTAVDNAEKQDFMRSLGADEVLDYGREDFTRGGHRYDLILDAAGHRAVWAYRRALNPGGRYLYVGGSASTLLQILLLGPLLGRRAGKRIRLLVVRLGVKHAAPLVELVQAGAIRAVIDRRYSLSETPQAIQYHGDGHAKGKVLVVID